MIMQRHAGDGGADAETARRLFNGSHLGDLLDVDDHARLHHAGAHLDQKISTAGQDAPRASGCGKRANRLIKRIGRQISEFRHGGSVVSLFCPPHMGSGLISGPQLRQTTRANRVGTASGVRLWRQAPMQEAGLRRVSPG